MLRQEYWSIFEHGINLESHFHCNAVYCKLKKRKEKCWNFQWDFSFLHPPQCRSFTCGSRETAQMYERRPCVVIPIVDVIPSLFSSLGALEPGLLSMLHIPNMFILLANALVEQLKSHNKIRVFTRGIEMLPVKKTLNFPAIFSHLEMAAFHTSDCFPIFTWWGGSFECLWVTCFFAKWKQGLRHSSFLEHPCLNTSVFFVFF